MRRMISFGMAVLLAGGVGAPTAAGASTPGREPTVAAAGALQSSAAAQNLDGRLEVFCQCDGAMKHSYELRPGGPWSPLVELNPNGSGYNPEIIRNRDGRLELFVRTSNGIEHQWQLWPGGAWSPLVLLVGRNITQPAFSFLSMSVTINSDGRLEVFYTGCGDQGDGCEVGPFVGHLFQSTPGGAWSSPLVLTGGIPNGPVTAFANANGDLEVMVVGTPVMLDLRQSGFGWSATQLPQGPVGQAFQVEAARNVDGRAELFASRGPAVYHAWQDRPGGSWSTWELLSTTTNTPYFGVGRNADGRLELFVADHIAQTTTHVWQDQPGAGWSPSVPLTTGSADFVLGALPDVHGRMQVFVQPTTYHGISRTGQPMAGAGPWSPFVAL